MSGVTNLCNKYQRVIVVEDDLVVAPQFLRFLNAGLEKYQNETSVMQVSGHMFSVPEFAHRNKAVFLPFTTSWGWATWKRAWDYFDAEASGWEVLQTDKQMQKSFNLDGYFDYFNMLKQQMSGKIDSWAIRWYWSVFKNNGCVVYPPTSYVNNIGFDGSGTHSKFGKLCITKIFTKANYSTSLTYVYLPTKVQRTEEDMMKVKKALLSFSLSWISYLINCLKLLLF